MVTKRGKGRRSGQLTLRIPSDVHEDLAKVAQALGLDINGLLNLMIRRHLERYELEAQTLARQKKENPHMVALWQQKYPARPIREFWSDFQAYEAAKRAYAANQAGWEQWLAEGRFDFGRVDASTRGGAKGSRTTREKRS
jgi:antitoxin component of RelBE/YafQ-DinJ toxin-antitoxin module